MNLWQCLGFFPFPQCEILGCVNCCLGDMWSWSGGQLRFGHILQNNVWVSCVASCSTPLLLHLLWPPWWALSEQKNIPSPQTVPSFDYNTIWCGCKSICVWRPLPTGQQRARHLPTHGHLVAGTTGAAPIPTPLNSWKLSHQVCFCVEQSLFSKQRRHLFSQRLLSSCPQNIHTFTCITDWNAESRMGCSQGTP